MQVSIGYISGVSGCNVGEKRGCVRVYNKPLRYMGYLGVERRCRSMPHASHPVYNPYPCNVITRAKWLRTSKGGISPDGKAFPGCGAHARGTCVHERRTLNKNKP